MYHVKRDTRRPTLKHLNILEMIAYYFIKRNMCHNSNSNHRLLSITRLFGSEIMKSSKKDNNEKSPINKEQPEEMERKISKTFRWDELNNLQTFHPPGKTYGHIKCTEPDTPYFYNAEVKEFNPQDLAARLMDQSGAGLKCQQVSL